MSSKYRLVINTLIILLMIVLVYVMLNYYASGVSVVSNPNNNVSGETTNSINSSSGNSIFESGSVIKSIGSGEEKTIIPETVKNDATDTSYSGNSEPVSNIDKDTQKTQVKTENKWSQSSPVIMKSENDISSTEKREILGELDKTLMELLDVVDSVKTVDESRLPTDSEVEP